MSAIWPLEHNVTRALGNPLRFVELLKELADVAPHRCKFVTIDFSPEHQEWYFYWGPPKLWEMVFQSECCPTKLEKVWAFFGPLASELECFPSAKGKGFLEETILAVIGYYRHGRVKEPSPLPLADKESQQ